MARGPGHCRCLPGTQHPPPPHLPLEAPDLSATTGRCFRCLTPFSGCQEPLQYPESQIQGRSYLLHVPSLFCSLGSFLRMAQAQAVRSSPSSGPPTLRGQKLSSSARRVCLASFSLKAVFSRGLPCAKRLATTRPDSQQAGLDKHGPVHSLFPSVIPMFLTQGAWSPAAWTSGTEHRQSKLGPLWLFLAPPPCSVPRKILLLPEWVQLEG